MLLLEAKELAIGLMDKHGLLDERWYFEFDNAKRRFGRCYHGLKKITLSNQLVQLNTKERVKDTILHEIAHALVGRGHGHDNIWKRKAIEIGCDGKRCFNGEDTVLVEGSYKAVCPKCGHIHTKHRKPRTISSCGICSKIYDSERRLIFVKNNKKNIWISENLSLYLSY
jgi:predicted SprT family Zn-dependent metalloprotease